ncbi:hypothetical protein FACS1894111_07510 [Clostridia bacterium]|nr:hypothetical protein FACS1894111_07510 [Clostridia bacterium]
MDKGLPVLTVGYGDVGMEVTEEFWVKDYQQMKEEIRHYYMDAEYYRRQSKLIKEIALNLQDTDGAFAEIICEVEQRLAIPCGKG